MVKEQKRKEFRKNKPFIGIKKAVENAINNLAGREK
jgi:hypothetical protein